MVPARRLTYAGLASSALMFACTCTPTRSSDTQLPQVETAAYDANVRRDLVRVRAATTAFHDIAIAHAAGFPTATPDCLSAATGGMGQHYLDRRLLDDQLEVEKPEILLYAPTRDGKQKLVAVEYIVPLSKWQDQRPPRIFGQSLKRSDELKLWYLHVWAWEQNKEGLFADWNPAVKC